MAGDELVPALGGEPLELPDLGRALLKGGADKAAGNLVLAAGLVSGRESKRTLRCFFRGSDACCAHYRVP